MFVVITDFYDHNYATSLHSIWKIIPNPLNMTFRMVDHSAEIYDTIIVYICTQIGLECFFAAELIT